MHAKISQGKYFFSKKSLTTNWHWITFERGPTKVGLSSDDVLVVAAVAVVAVVAVVVGVVVVVVVVAVV